MKYIDAEKLIHDLEERIYAYSEEYANGDNYRKDAIETLLKDVKYQLSSQQEQTELSDYKRGYIAGKRYYERGPIDMKVHLGNVPDEITQEVINWFVNYAPEWGVTLQNNRWQYHLANHFYNLGVAHEKRALLKLREEIMQKYNLELLDELQIEYPLTPDEGKEKI